MQPIRMPAAYAKPASYYAFPNRPLGGYVRQTRRPATNSGYVGVQSKARKSFVAKNVNRQPAETVCRGHDMPFMALTHNRACSSVCGGGMWSETQNMVSIRATPHSVLMSGIGLLEVANSPVTDILFDEDTWRMNGYGCDPIGLVRDQKGNKLSAGHQLRHPQKLFCAETGATWLSGWWNL